METASETEAELSDLHRALDDATELLAVFLSCARGNELPPALLIDSTDKVIDRVAEWRSIISRTKAIQFEAREVMLKSALHQRERVADDLLGLRKALGRSRPGLTEKMICAILWGKDERHVTEGMKWEASSRCGYSGHNDPRCVADNHGKTCEIDHLISRELGGADVVDNLWPQSYGSPWNAHMKDKLENRLHNEMCKGALTLKQARALLRNDWREAYKQYYGTP